MVERLHLMPTALPVNATAEDRARAYANLAGQLAATIKRMDDDVVDTKAAAIAASGAAHRAEAKGAATHERLEGLIKEFGTIKEALSYFTTFLDNVKEKAEAIAKETAEDAVEENTGRYHSVLFHAAVDAATANAANVAIAKEAAPRRSDPVRAIDSALDKRELDASRRAKERIWAVVIGAGSIGVWELVKLLFVHH